MRGGPRVTATPPAPGQATPAPASRPQRHRPSCPGRGRPSSLQHRRELRFPEGPHGICRNRLSVEPETASSASKLPAPRAAGWQHCSAVGAAAPPPPLPRPPSRSVHARPPGETALLQAGPSPHPGPGANFAARTDGRSPARWVSPPGPHAAARGSRRWDPARTRVPAPATPRRPGSRSARSSPPAQQPSAPAPHRPRGRVSEGPNPPVGLGSEE